MHDVIRLFLAMCVSQGILVLSIISVAVFFYFQDQPKSSQNTSSLNEEELRKIRRKRMAAIAEARVVDKVDKDTKKTSTQTNTSQPTTPKTVDKENWSVDTSLDDIVSTNTKGQKNGDTEVNSSISSGISSNKNVSTYVDDTKGWGSGQEASEEEDSNSTFECFGEEEDRVMRIGIVPNDSRERTQQAIAKYLAISARVMSTISPKDDTQSKIHIEGMFMSQQDDNNGSSDSACDDSPEDGSDSSTISSLSACSNLDIYAQDVQTNAIEDIIIRHMKERKTILQQQLVSYIQSWYCYTLQSVEINNGIEALIHKGYLERRVGDSERLRYVPLM